MSKHERISELRDADFLLSATEKNPRIFRIFTFQKIKIVSSDHRQTSDLPCMCYVSRELTCPSHSVTSGLVWPLPRGEFLSDPIRGLPRLV